MHLRPKRDKAQRGNAVIEVSLILMLMLMIMFGCIDFGFVLFEYQTLAHQARSAARYGAINPSDVAAIRNVVLYGSPALPDGKSEGDPGFFGVTSSMVSVARFDATKPEDRIVVGVSGYQIVLVGPYIAGTFTGKPITVSLPVEPQ